MISLPIYIKHVQECRFSPIASVNCFCLLWCLKNCSLQ